MALMSGFEFKPASTAVHAHAMELAVAPTLGIVHQRRQQSTKVNLHISKYNVRVE